MRLERAKIIQRNEPADLYPVQIARNQMSWCSDTTSMHWCSQRVWIIWTFAKMLYSTFLNGNQLKKRITCELWNQGLQRDVGYLALPITPSYEYMSPNAGWGGELRGLSQWVQADTGANKKKLRRSNSIINLCVKWIREITKNYMVVW